jgi:hypothetical protein
MEVLFKQVYEIVGTSFYNEYTPLIDYHDNDDTFIITHKEIIHHDEKNPYFNYLKSTNDPEVFLKNYGNPMTSVWVERLTLVVESNDDKVSMKIFHYIKSRDVGKVYFKISSNLDFITYNIKTNDFYNGFINRTHKKNSIRKSLKRNYFGGNSNPFQLFLNSIHNKILRINDIKKLTTNTFQLFENMITKFFEKVPNFELSTNLNNLNEQVYKHYLSTRNIKYPDNYLSFISKTPFPNKRILKKYDYKFIDSFMHVHKMRGSKIKKILHNTNIINEHLYHECVDLFSEDFIINQSYEDLKLILTYNGGSNFRNLKPQFTDKELKLVFSTLVQTIQYGSLTTFVDHIQFFIQLNNHEKIKWKAYDLESLNKEHVDWADKWSYYTKGSYTRIYNEDFINKIESKPLQNDFYPTILKNSGEYISESSFQSNCVKTYVDRPASLIISVQENKNESNERATIEYRIQKLNSKISLKRVQSLGKFNNRLPEKWNPVLSELDTRLNNIINENGFDMPKIICEYKSGYKKESDSGFTDKGSMVWLNPEVFSREQYNYLF